MAGPSLPYRPLPPASSPETQEQPPTPPAMSQTPPAALTPASSPLTALPATPPRPFTPMTIMHTRYPRPSAPLFNRLACILTNRLQMDIQPVPGCGVGIFSQDRNLYEIYYHEIHRLSVEVRDVGLRDIPGLDYLEMQILATKKQNSWVTNYVLEAKLTCRAKSDRPIKIGPGDGELGIGTVYGGEKKWVIGAKVVAEVNVVAEDDKKLWDELSWKQVQKWLKIVSKRTFNGYGEARNGDQIKEWEDKLELVAKLGDGAALIRAL